MVVPFTEIGGIGRKSGRTSDGIENLESFNDHVNFENIEMKIFGMQLAL